MNSQKSLNIVLGGVILVVISSVLSIFVWEQVKGAPSTNNSSTTVQESTTVAESLTGPIRYNCELSGGTFKDDHCSCSIEENLGQTQESMYDKNTGFCQSTIGGPAGNAFNASIGLPYGDYNYWTGIVLGVCIDSGGSISGAACICPSGKIYSKTSGKCE